MPRISLASCKQLQHEIQDTDWQRDLPEGCRKTELIASLVTAKSAAGKVRGHDEGRGSAPAFLKVTLHVAPSPKQRGAFDVGPQRTSQASTSSTSSAGSGARLGPSRSRAASTHPVVGHSLGAGTAAVLTLLLRSTPDLDTRIPKEKVPLPPRGPTDRSRVRGGWRRRRAGTATATADCSAPRVRTQ